MILKVTLTSQTIVIINPIKRMLFDLQAVNSPRQRVFGNLYTKGSPISRLGTSVASLGLHPVGPRASGASQGLRSFIQPTFLSVYHVPRPGSPRLGLNPWAALRDSSEKLSRLEGLETAEHRAETTCRTAVFCLPAAHEAASSGTRTLYLAGGGWGRGERGFLEVLFTNMEQFLPSRVKTEISALRGTTRVNLSGLVAVRLTPAIPGDPKGKSWEYKCC